MKAGRVTVTAFFLWLGLTLFIFACGLLPGAQTGGEEDGGEPIGLRVVYSSGDIRWIGSMEWVAEEFMKKYPQIQVTLTAPADVPGQSFTDRLKVLIAQDEFYDVVELREAVQFSDAGYLAPLPGSLTDLIDGVDEHELCYAIPRYTTTQGIVYNRELFDRLGLSIPQNYEDFLAVCDSIRRNGVNPVAVGGTDIWHMGFWGNYLYQNYLLDENNESRWERERVVTMLADFRSLNRRGYIDDRFFSISDSQTIQELASGNAAMLYSGPWIMDQVTALNPQMDLGFFYLPGRDGRVRAMVDDSVTWGISAQCKEDEKRFEAAAEFLKFFYSEGIYEHILTRMNGNSVTVRPVRDQETMAQKTVQQAGERDVIFCSRFVGDEETPDGFRSFYAQCLQEALWGDTGLEEIAEELENRWKKQADGQEGRKK
ncbi:MAG: extracellular solute-binding protein [Lachnospiraceae bacterium]|nr:extracellular solute-binding protein [Lachnospiraceae bacterium]